MGIEIQADSGVVNYIAMFNLLDGNPIFIKFCDAKYNELVEDPAVIDNLSSKWNWCMKKITLIVLL